MKVKNKTVFQVTILIVVTVIIIIVGILLPKLLIDLKINSNGSIENTVEVNAISPYGEETLALQSRIRDCYANINVATNLNTAKYLTSYSYDDPEVAKQIEFSNKLISTINNIYGYVYHPAIVNELGSPNYSETGMIYIYDGSLSSPINFFAEEESGIVVLGELEFRSIYIESERFWDEVRKVYSNSLGMEFVDTEWSSDMTEMYGRAITPDGSMQLVMTGSCNRYAYTPNSRDYRNYYYQITIAIEVLN